MVDPVRREGSNVILTVPNDESEAIDVKLSPKYAIKFAMLMLKTAGCTLEFGKDSFVVTVPKPQAETSKNTLQ